MLLIMPVSPAAYAAMAKLITDARRHVNKLCQAANTPLIESGTAGYMGQAVPHLKVGQLTDPSVIYADEIEQD
jgi:hypothetical protein